MSWLLYRSASICAVGLMVAADAREARAEEPTLAATMQCDRASEPGRVRCSVEARSTNGRTISWADVVLLEVPEFAAALKGRIGPSDITAKDSTTQKWAFGLVARKVGQGEARARVRALLCESQPQKVGADGAAPRCAPVTVDVKASVQVG